MSTKKLSWRINHQIKATDVRVIAQDGKQLGIMSLSKALEESQKSGADLVEIAPNASPPVVKIVDYMKFIYQEEKKRKKDQKKSKKTDLKEIRFSPFIAENDYSNRVRRIRKFLEEKHKIRLTVVFKGRQLGSKKFGYELLKRVLRDLGDNIKADSEPKFFGRHLQMTITPIKGGSINNNGQTEN